MRTLLLVLLMAVRPGFAANTHLFVNTTGTGSDSGPTCLTNETDDRADSPSSDDTLSARLQYIAMSRTTFANGTAGTPAFHIPLSSAPIDAGTNTAADSAPIDFTTDIDGVALTAPWGIGADEYAPSVERRKRVGAIQ